MRGRHDLTDAEWAIISPLLPDKPLGQARGAGGALAGIFSSHRLLGGARPPARRGREKGVRITPSDAREAG